jgi:uncharacterized membrane protein
MALTLFILIIAPFIITKVVTALKIKDWFSPIVACFVTGIILGNTGILKVETQLFEPMSSVTVLLAIPLLLMTTDFKAWIRHVKPFLMGISMAVLGVFLASLLVFFWLGKGNPQSPLVLAMYTGSLIGTSANVSAIGLALKADSNTFMMVSSIDVLCGGILLLYLIGIAPKLYRAILLPYKALGSVATVHSHNKNDSSILGKLSDVGFSIATALLIAGASVGTSFLLFGKLKEEIVLCLLSLFAVVMGVFSSKIRSLSTAEPLGQYLLLIFCFAVGIRADLSAIVHKSSEILTLMAAYSFFAVLFQLILYKIFRVDSDTAVMTTAGTIFGPAFIGQIETALGNKEVLLTGMVTAVLGYAMGNFAGFLVFELFSYLN